MILETPRKSKTTSRTLLKSPLSPDCEDTYDDILHSRRRQLQSSSNSRTTNTSSPYLAATRDSLHWFRARQEKWKTAPRPRIQKVHIDTNTRTAAAVPASADALLSSTSQTTTAPGGNNNKKQAPSDDASKKNVLVSKQLFLGSGGGSQESSSSSTSTVTSGSSFGIGNNKTNTSTTGATSPSDTNSKSGLFSFSGNSSAAPTAFGTSSTLLFSKNQQQQQSTDKKASKETSHHSNNGALFQNGTTQGLSFGGASSSSNNNNSSVFSLSSQQQQQKQPKTTLVGTLTTPSTVSFADKGNLVTSSGAQVGGNSLTPLVSSQSNNDSNNKKEVSSFVTEQQTPPLRSESTRKTTTNATTATATAVESKPLFGNATTSTTATPFSFSNSTTQTITTTQQQPSSATQTTTIAATTATANSNSAANHRNRLIAFYKQHNPSKLDSVDATLQKYQDKEDELFRKLQAKYTTPAAATDDDDDLNYLPATGSGPICFLKFSTGHSIQVELFADKTPFAAENFRCLCTGEKGPSYRNCIVHRIVPNFCIQAGDYTAGNGTGGKSIYPASSSSTPKTDMWGNFQDETPFLRHDAAGLLSMANNGPNRNSSQFFITLRPLPHLNGKHVVFGRVVKDMVAVEELGKLETDPERQRPIQELRIVECGQVITEDDDSSKEEELDDEDAPDSSKDRSTSNPFAPSAASSSQLTPFGSGATFALTGTSSSAGSSFDFEASKGTWSMFSSSKECDIDAKQTTPFSSGTTETEKMTKTTTFSIFKSSFGTNESTQTPNHSTGRTHSDDDDDKNETSVFSFGSQTKSFNLSHGSGNSSDDKNIPPTNPFLSDQVFAPETDTEAITKDVNVEPSTTGRAFDATLPSDEVAYVESSKLASKGSHSADEKPSFSFPSNFRDVQGTPSLSSQEHDSLALSDTSSSAGERGETALPLLDASSKQEKVGNNQEREKSKQREYFFDPVSSDPSTLLAPNARDVPRGDSTWTSSPSSSSAVVEKKENYDGAKEESLPSADRAVANEDGSKSRREEDTPAVPCCTPDSPKPVAPEVEEKKEGAATVSVQALDDTPVLVDGSPGKDKETKWVDKYVDCVAAESNLALGPENEKHSLEEAPTDAPPAFSSCVGREDGSSERNSELAPVDGSVGGSEGVRSNIREVSTGIPGPTERMSSSPKRQPLLDEVTSRTEFLSSFAEADSSSYHEPSLATTLLENNDEEDALVGNQKVPSCLDQAVASRKKDAGFSTPSRTKKCIADSVSTGTNSCHSPSKTMASLLILDPLTVPVLHSMSPSRMRTGLVPPADWGAVHLSSVRARTDSTSAPNSFSLIKGHRPDRASHFCCDPLMWLITGYS